MQYLTKVADLTADTTLSILDKAFQFKDGHIPPTEKPLAGKVIAMIFEKPSLRTKVAFEVAAASLGATPVFLTSSQILASGSNQQGRESVPDIARNLERFADLILARVYSHEVIEEITGAINKPVINGLCDRHHPTQSLADLMAIHWHMKKKGLNPSKDKIKVAFVGDGNNVATSLMQICALTGINFSVASPDIFQIPVEEIDVAISLARDAETTLEFINDPEVAVKDADVVYTDTFVSMGQEEERQGRIDALKRFQVNFDLMAKAKDGALFMHCLPAHRGEEVTSAVFDSEQSIVFDQAECRLHIAKSLYCHLLSV